MLNKILKGAILTAKTADVDFSGVAISGSKLTGDVVKYHYLPGLLKSSSTILRIL